MIWHHDNWWYDYRLNQSWQAIKFREELQLQKYDSSVWWQEAKIQKQQWISKKIKKMRSLRARKSQRTELLTFTFEALFRWMKVSSEKKESDQRKWLWKKLRSQNSQNNKDLHRLSSWQSHKCLINKHRSWESCLLWHKFVQWTVISKDHR